MTYATALEIFLYLLKGGIKILEQGGAPADVIDAGRAFVAAVKAHHNDELTKANFEAQRD